MNNIEYDWKIVIVCGKCQRKAETVIRRNCGAEISAGCKHCRETIGLCCDGTFGYDEFIVGKLYARLEWVPTP